MKTVDRIRKRMAELKLKSVDIVELTGVSKGSVSNWVNGTTEPSGINLLKLSKALQCAPEWLATGKEKAESNAEFIGSIAPWDSDTPLNSDEVELPLFKEVELAAGDGSTQVEEIQGAKLRFSRSTLKKCNVSINDAACASVAGRSMEPVLPDGTTVGIDKSQTKITDGKMYAIDHDGMLRVKLLYRVAGGAIRIASYNKEEYPDEVVTGEDMQELRIIGRVFWSSALW